MFCGCLRAITLKWPGHDEKREKAGQIPAIVHLRLWFGKVADRGNWDEAIKPGVIQYFAEVFENQRRLMGGQWVETVGKKFGLLEFTENIIQISIIGKNLFTE